MSLVNDMLRDLEARRAAPGEWPLRDGLQAVDEAAAARRERTERLRRGLIWLGAVILLGVMVGLMIGRVVNGDPPPFFASEPVANTPVVVPSAPRVLEVLPQNDGRRLLLQVLLDSSVAYQRSEESGAVSLFLPGVQMGAEPYQGRVQKAGRSLSWRVEAKDEGVQILLVGLGEQLQLSDRLEPAGDRWLLWLEVPLQATAAEAVEPAVEAFAPATAAPVEVEAPLPDWASRPVSAAIAARALPPLIYGEGHPYGRSFSGSGDEAVIRGLTRADLAAEHARWIRPDNAKLFVVSDLPLAELKPQLEAAFGDWRPRSSQNQGRRWGERAVRNGSRRP